MLGCVGGVPARGVCVGCGAETTANLFDLDIEKRAAFACLCCCRTRSTRRSNASCPQFPHFCCTSMKVDVMLLSTPTTLPF